MSRLTFEMQKKILEVYKECLSYKRVAEELGIDERTVRKYVEEDRKMSSEATAEVITSIIPANHLPKHNGGAVVANRDSQFIPLGNAQIISGNPTSSAQLKLKYSSIDEATSSNAYSQESEELKIVYKGFRAGMTPDEIISIHGFGPKFVLGHYRLFNQMRNSNIETIQGGMLKAYRASQRPRLAEYSRRFDNKRYLTQKETIGYMQKVVELESEKRAIEMLSNPNEQLPDNWWKVKCPDCGEVSKIIRFFKDTDIDDIEDPSSYTDRLCYRCKGYFDDFN